MEPALISTRQLTKMKNILFNHVNGKCERTSVHSSENGVARPLQPLNDRPLYQCMCRDFIGDKDRQWVSLLSVPRSTAEQTFLDLAIANACSEVSLLY